MVMKINIYVKLRNEVTKQLRIAKKKNAKILGKKSKFINSFSLSTELKKPNINTDSPSLHKFKKNVYIGRQLSEQLPQLDVNGPK